MRNILQSMQTFCIILNDAFKLVGMFSIIIRMYSFTFKHYDPDKI